MGSAKVNPKSTSRQLPVIGTKSASESSKEDRNSRIAVAAYYKAQARGFEPGHEMEDWLAAETEVEQ